MAKTVKGAIVQELTKPLATLLASIALSSGLTGCVSQSTGAYDGAMTVTIENDVLTSSDNNYTNGIGVSWVSNELGTYDEDRFVSKWGKFWSFLPAIEDQGYRTYVAWSVAQEMHTPTDIANPNPPLDDQPYAGVLYLDSLLYARNERWTHVWSLKVGVVGPASQAENFQKKFHEWTGSEEPMGWDTQMPNEVILNVGYAFARLLAEGNLGKSAEWRLVPVGGASFGNYFTGIGGGLYGEVGWNLVEAFGSTALRSGFNVASTVGVGPVDGWSVSFSGGLGGNAIGHYLPLDGTVFHDSRSVDSEPFLGLATLAFTVRHRGLTLSFTKTFFTDLYKTEPQKTDYGTFNVSWLF